ncbi:MAG: hypothetical protein Q7T71_08885, partial [Herbiconiux sp.]|nr:hypothetical protein [Herbiconiux sp.]
MGQDEISAPAGRSVRPRRRAVILMLFAVATALMIPAVYAGGLAYGASWLEWDEDHGTYFYAERPGGFAVVAGS